MMDINLTDNLLKECRDVFAACEEFADDESLRALFITPILKPLRAGLPDASNLKERVNQCIAYLVSKRTRGNQPALLALVDTLVGAYDGVGLQKDLTALRQKLAESANSKAAVSEAKPRLDPSTLPIPSPIDLRNYLIKHFSSSEMESLCFEITQSLAAAGNTTRVDLDDVGGYTKTAQALNLVQYLDRRGLLNYLIAGIRKSEYWEQFPI